jgi:transcriptional regulator GlxA family with amidase domain
MMRAQVVVFDGFDPLHVVAAYEVLLAGGVASGGVLAVELVSPGGPGQVAAGSGDVLLHATGVLDPDCADVVVMPGAIGPVAVPVLVKHALDNPEVTVAAVGGGGLALASAGLIERRHVATHDLDADLFDGTGAVAVRARVVDDGDLITSGGVTAGLDLGLYLLERELGPRVALDVEQRLGYERRGTVWRQEGAVPIP